MPIVVPGSSPAPPAGIVTVTVATLVTRIRKLMEDYPWQDKLSLAYTAGSGVLSLSQITNWAEGSIVEIDDATGSQFYITSTGTLSNPTNVQASYRGTDDVNHLVNATVLRDPRWGYAAITEAITRVVADLWPWVWNSLTNVLTPSSTTDLYVAPADAIDIQKAAQSRPVGSITDVDFYGAKGSGRPIELIGDVPAALASTGKAFRFPGGFFNSTRDVTVTYRAQITTSSIQEGTMAECVIMGAIARLLAGKEITLGAQDKPQTQTSNVPGTLVRDAGYYQLRYEDQRRGMNGELWTREPPARKWMR